MRLVRYQPLGRCMYCLAAGGAGVELSEEHLIPRALGGRLTLPDAVCEPCRRLTGRLEQATLEREFLVPKTLLALKRRRARGKGPSRLPNVALAGEHAPSILTADTFPRRFSLPVFAPAGRAPDTSRATDFVDCHMNLGSPSRQTAQAMTPHRDPFALAYSIAKWAYALAVAECGLDGWEAAPVRDLMLGRRNDVLAFVGNPSPPAVASREWLHDFAVREDAGRVTVTLAPFASAGMTPYEVMLAGAATGA